MFLYQWRELDGSLSSVEVAEINVTSSVISYMEGESQETLFRSECARFGGSGFNDLILLHLRTVNM